MKKILVIHPQDESTDFLKPIYRDLENVTLITGGPLWTHENIVKEIQEHDQVMMMGHGYPGGLFGIGFRRPTVINSDCVQALSEKENNIFIWCNADQFVRRHNLKGFFTGMFVSETGEALYCGLGRTEQSIVDESNQKFSSVMNEVLKSSLEPADIFPQIEYQYGLLAKVNKVAEYNHQRLFLETSLVV